jgi:outer membrane receptor for ferric coprogen and ferric-rhodotorulic acid
MPVTDSRLGPGTLVFDTTEDFSIQVSSCSLTPSTNETDGTATLAEPTPASEVTFDWNLTGDTISDWSDATGFVNWAMDNAGSEVTFAFTPSTAAGVDYSGTVQVRPIQIGGDVSAQSVVSFEFPLTGAPTRA